MVHKWYGFIVDWNFGFNERFVDVLLINMAMMLSNLLPLVGFKGNLTGWRHDYSFMLKRFNSAFIFCTKWNVMFNRPGDFWWVYCSWRNYNVSTKNVLVCTVGLLCKTFRCLVLLKTMYSDPVRVIGMYRFLFLYNIKEILCHVQFVGKTKSSWFCDL